MEKPALYARKPILSAPLRWRVELAALCLILAVISPWVPVLPIALLSLLIFAITFFTILYPYMEGAERSVLTPDRPLLNKVIGIFCLAGVLALGTFQFLTDDYSLSLSFYLLIQGGLLSSVPRMGDRKSARDGSAVQTELSIGRDTCRLGYCRGFDLAIC